MYNKQFSDAIDKLNKMAYMIVNGNANIWARKAASMGIISYDDRARIGQFIQLRNTMDHGGAMYMRMGSNEVQEVNNFIRIMSNTANRLNKNSSNDGRNNGCIQLPKGTFRFEKVIRLQGIDGNSYIFRFRIVKEYQKRAYDDGSKFSGTGYTIYVLDAPYKDWAIQYNGQFEFHYYNSPIDRPSICWNELITDFQDANAVMITWAKRYVKIIVSLLKRGEVNINYVERSVKNKGILPDGTFRMDITKKNRKSYKKNTIFIEENVYQQILNTIGFLRPEKGGMLGSYNGTIIDRFVFDKNASTATAEYSPNTEFLNQVLINEWGEIDFRGFVHSHPFGGSELSSADIKYAQRIMKAMSLNELFMPLVNSSYEGKFHIYGYIVKLNGTVIPCDIQRVKANETTTTKQSKLTEEEILMRFEHKYSPIIEESNDSAFSRIEKTINLDFLNRCTIIGVGCGGACDFYIDMARVGIKNFVLMDGDKVSITNIACQNVFTDEIGQFKTDVAKKYIQKVNSDASVISINEMLDDTKTDEWFEQTILSKCEKSGNILLCAFTDNFFAQARLSRLSLKYSIPFLSAQHHFRGETSELIFWYPGVTKYCQRDILSSRYESYRNGYKNTVTSEGSPIFNTSRLNALCEKIAVGMLLYKDSESNVYSTFLTMKPNSNLIIIRQNSLLNSNNSLKDYFKADDKGYFFDDALWVDLDEFLKYDNLCECRGQIRDTREVFN